MERQIFGPISHLFFLDKFAELAKGKVLDLGSGPGRDAVLLNQRGLAVTCLDASQTMAEMSRKIGFDSVVADMESIPFQDNCFDGVWAYTSLLHVPKSDFFKSVREIKRVLKNQGVFALGMIEGDAEGYRIGSSVDSPRWFSFYKKEEIKNILEDSGFEMIYFHSFIANTKYFLNFLFRNNK